MEEVSESIEQFDGYMLYAVRWHVDLQVGTELAPKLKIDLAHSVQSGVVIPYTD